MAKIQNGYFSQNTHPRWAGDFTGREHNLPGGVMLEPGSFIQPAYTDILTVGETTDGETEIAVTWTESAGFVGPIPKGTVLNFSASIGTSDVVLAQDANLDDDVLHVHPITAVGGAIGDGEEARYYESSNKALRSGTAIGRTYAERDAETGFGPLANTDDQVYLLIHDVDDVTEAVGVAVYRPGGLVYENYLPGFDGLAANIKAKIRATYDCQIGAD